jgi:hypothetical protein
MQLPPPEYIMESLPEAAIYGQPNAAILALGALPEALAEQLLLHKGPLVIRFGLSFNQPSAKALLPGLLVSERGAVIVGRAAWDFMFKKFQLFPRADVIGMTPQGKAEQVFLRELDFGAPVRMFAYPSVEDNQPIAELKWLIAPTEVSWPDLVIRYLPIHQVLP